MSRHEQPTQIPFTRENYYFIIAGVVLVILGFMAMIGGGSTEANEFNEAELFSFRRITLAPFLVILGYVVVLVGILRRPKNENKV
ncbi:MAG TPA: DUF3098 domain-containing protein [Flavobacteriales bacterium]|nr:DUF3098 domain-containing protein [Flavobacteriales bacterium]HCA82899.1 DUF3098 domain-containing protein [Flavobacteriales bacterium]HRE73706.1 DUF3098 domain-containing protein [Flavobacteriales bacterium]HRE96374.1 DUF3098 domain-containing protein [Flavobacteriales bacterium]HRJ34732.1 DUF3098 domain-containing protein [Flavobacteriales bacterium]